MRNYLALAAWVLVAACSGDGSGDAAQPNGDNDSDTVTDTDTGDSTPTDYATLAAAPSAGCSAAFTRPTYTSENGVITLPIATVPNTGERTVRPYIPPAFDNTTARPLILFLHGGGGNGQQQWGASTFQALADKENVVFGLPDGLNQAGNVTPHVLETWNGGGCCGASAASAVDDVTFIEAVVAYFETTYCIDTNRVYVGGFSNGGIMAYRLGCDAADRFAAFASFSGPNMTSVGFDGASAVGCSPSRRIPVIHVHGTNDHNAPYAGGVGSCSNQQSTGGTDFTAVETYVPAWASANGCGPGADVSWEGGAITTGGQSNPCVIVDGTCPGNEDVVLCTIPGGGHGIPGTADNNGCDDDGPIVPWFDGATAMWNFFKAHPRLQSTP